MASITIGTYDVSGYVTTQPYATQKIRSESVSYALDGSMLIDRVGSPKAKITIAVGSMPRSVWDGLKAVLQTAAFAVAFNDGQSNVITGTFHCMSEIPENYIYFGDSMADPSLVGGFSLELEEV